MTADEARRDDNVAERLNETDIYGNSVSGGNNRLHGISISIDRFNLHGMSLDYFDKTAKEKQLRCSNILELILIQNKLV